MIELKSVSKFYTHNEVVAQGMRRVCLTMKKGEFIAVTGESGSGKSTFLNVISGIDSYEEGELIIDGVDTAAWSITDWEVFRRNNISFIFQDNNLIDSYSVLKNVEVALYPIIKNHKERRKRALQLIRQVGLESHIKHRASKLSGGQKQRAVIARALAKDSPMLLADEPTGNLDTVAGKEIMKLLSDISEDKLVVVVTHDFEDLEAYATRKIRFYDGGIVEDKKLFDRQTYAVTSDIKQQSEPSTKVKSVIKHIKNTIYKGGVVSKIGGANVISTPKKTIFTFFMYVAVLVASLLILASILDLASWKSYYPINSVQLHKNGAEFTDDDLEKISKLGASYIDKNYYEESEVSILDKSGNVFNSNIKVASINSYVSNQYSIKEGSDKLDRGEALLIGNYYELYLNTYISIINKQTTKELSNNQLKIMINGFADGSQAGQIIYLHNDDYVNWQSKAKICGETKINIHMGEENLIISVMEDSSLSENTIQLNLNNVLNDTVDKFLFKIQDKIYFLEDIAKGAKIINGESNYLAYISTDIYEKIKSLVKTQDLNCYFNTSSTSQMKSNVQALENAGYNTFYNYGFQDQNVDDSGASIIKVIAYIVAISFAMVLLVVLYVVTSRLVNMKSKDYVILRALGYSKSNVFFVLLVEFFLLATAAFIAVFSVMFPIQMLLRSVLNTLSISTYFVFYLMILLGSVVIAIKTTKHLFNVTIRKTRGAK